MTSIRDIDIEGRMVFIRVDCNVPLNDQQQITEDARIRAALPTIEYAIQQNAKVVLASHLGRPGGTPQDKFRLQPVADRLSELLNQPVHYTTDCIGPEVDAAKAKLQNGEVLLLENLRFHKEEKENDAAFAAELAKDIDVYITDAFGVIHRKHASTSTVAEHINQKGIGFLIEKETQALNTIMDAPEKPFVVIIGGIKISDKVDVIRNLAPQADAVLTAGGVANTFMKGLGYDIGGSLVEGVSMNAGQSDTDYVALAMDIWKEVHGTDGMPDDQTIYYPIDVVIAPSPDAADQARTVDVGEPIPEGWMFLDIGPKTIKRYTEIISTARTIFWNGPIGVFEIDALAQGSKEIARACAENDAYSVLGGGDTEALVQKFGFADQYNHLSTGGGASLTYVAKNDTPGLDAVA